MRDRSESFVNFLHRTATVLFPGGMGTELQRRGYRSALPLWSAAANLDAPELVEQIHADYFAAGADVAITNTFRTTPRTFRKAGRESEAEAALKKSADIALSAKKRADRQVFVGGSFAPLEDCYRPDLVPSADELREEHGQLAAWLAEAGVDFLLAENINAGLEAQIMAEAASAAGLAFIVSFVVDADARLLDGTPIEDAVRRTGLPGRVGVALNCLPIGTLDEAFDKLSQSYDGAIGLYPNGAWPPAWRSGLVLRRKRPRHRRVCRERTAMEKGWCENHRRMLRHNAGLYPRIEQASARQRGGQAPAGSACPGEAARAEARLEPGSARAGIPVWRSPAIGKSIGGA